MKVLAVRLKTGAESAEGQAATAKTLWLAILCRDAKSRLRWAHRLQRHGLLTSVLQAGLQGGVEARSLS